MNANLQLVCLGPLLMAMAASDGEEVGHPEGLNTLGTQVQCRRTATLVEVTC
jgi:hypothetical protein